MLTLDQCLSANRPLIFVVAESDIEVLQHIYNIYGTRDLLLVYSSTLSNLVNLHELLSKSFNMGEIKSISFLDVLEDIIGKHFSKNNRQYTKIIFLDSQTQLDDSQHIRKIKDILYRYQLDNDFTVNLIFISQLVCVPGALERLGELVFFDLPDEHKLKEHSEILIEKLKIGNQFKQQESQKTLSIDEVVNNLKGLTLYEVEQAYLQSYHLYGNIELKFIRDFKKSAIAKTDLLSLMESDITFENIGGMKNLKEWIKKSYGGWTVEGKKFGLPLLKGLLLIGLPGTGKAQPLDSIIFTPNGPVHMGDLYIGAKVLTPYGGSTQIIEIHPQGIKDVYKISFEDGASVECTLDHLWKVHIRDRRHVADQWVVPTSFLMDKVIGRYDKKNNLYIGVPRMARTKMKYLAISPYILGALIGDGSFLNNSVSITSGDRQIIEKIKKVIIKKNCKLVYHKGRHGRAKQYRITRTWKRNRNKIISIIKDLGLLNKGSDEKFIPEKFLYASHKQRIELLKGLMDTDGYVSEKGHIEYSTVSKQLSEDFKLLVESLGGLCFINEKMPHYTKKNGIRIPCKKSYRCTIRININPFFIERKKKRIIPRTKYAKIQRVITNIEYIGKKPCQCIKINDLQNLYLTNHYIITHNSLIAKSIGNEWRLPVVSFDPGRIFSSRIGDSESNMRRVLKIVDNMAPCLTGDTRITLANGQVASIKELYDNNYREKIISMNNRFNLDTSNVTLITKKQSDNLYNVKATIGNIKATGDHKFPILKSNGEMHWISVQNLSVGDFIVCPRKINIEKVPFILDYFDDNTRFYSPVFCDQFLTIIKKENYTYYLQHNRRIRGQEENKKKGAWNLNCRKGFIFKHEIIKFKLDISDMSHIHKISRGKGGFQDSSLNKIPSEINEEIFYILGLLWSDGNIGDKGYWYYDKALKTAQKTKKYRQRNQNDTDFYNNELKLHETLNNFLFNIFGVTLKKYHNGKNNIKSGGIPLILAEFFRKLQKDLLSFSERFIWAWLAGVLDGDGHIHKQRINYSAIKHLNNEYIRDVLLRVGIPTSSPKNNFKNTNIEITSSKFIEIFKKNIHSEHPKKKNHLNLLSPLEKKCRFDTIDVREKLINLLISGNYISNYDIGTKHSNRYQTIFKNLSPKIKNNIHNYLEYNRNLDIDIVEEIFKNIGTNKEWYFNGNFFFSQIKEKNKIHGIHNVYDLCLDTNHNFIANRTFTHNCVLFIDEVEKGLAGLQSSTFSDSGVTARVIGSFLIWMQECVKPVFIVATANNIQYLPPELISRFDETFFVNLPQHSEREEIFNIHLKKLNRDPIKYDIKQLAIYSEDLSGREIEQALKDSMYYSFYNKKELSTEIMVETLKKKTNLITTMAEQLNYLLKWVGWDEEKKDGIRARFANVSESLDMGRVHTEINKILKDIEGKEESKD